MLICRIGGGEMDGWGESEGRGIEAAGHLDFCLMEWRFGLEL